MRTEDRNDKVTRFSAELVDAAAVEGARQSRSARQQLDHWVRVGRAVSDQTTVARRRVEQALSGSLDLDQLTEEEAVVVNAEVAAAIEENLAATSYGDVLAARGVTVVELSEDGELVEYAGRGMKSR